MKTLIKKEIRLLLPAWITAMLLATVPGILNIFWISSTFGASVFPFVQLVFAAGVLFLGINSFGEEMSYNTFSALLSQPMNRPRIWLVKIATLAAAFLSVWLTGVLIDSWQIGVLREHYQFSVAFEFLTLSALAAFSGGLWTTLLLRQVTGAFWFTLLTPLAIIFGIWAVFPNWIVSGKSFNTFIVAALILYSVGGFFLAWRLFMRAQDVQWTGGEITLPHRERISKSNAGSRCLGPRHWFSALAWKEFHMHQGTFLIAAIMLVLQATACLIQKIHPPVKNSYLEGFLDVIRVLWLLIPLLIGAGAIAEERRMATLESQLCLPVSRGMQLFIKFCMGLVLSLIFGALIPVLMEARNLIDDWNRFSIAAAAIFCISFYASSLGRTTLHSIGWALLLALVIYNVILFPTSSDPGLVRYANHFVYYPNQQLALDRLKLYLEEATLLLVLGWLTFSNFKHVHQNGKFWIRNFLAVLAVFVCVPFLAKAIYPHVWYLIQPESY